MRILVNPFGVHAHRNRVVRKHSRKQDRIIMRLLRPTVYGLVIGAIAGLICFLVILLLPSNNPNDIDHVGSLFILAFIAAVFVFLGGAAGSFLGFWLGGMYLVAMGTRSQRSRARGPIPKPSGKVQMRDHLLD